MEVRKEKVIPLTRVGERYQVTIPKDAREAVGLKAGDLVEARPGKGCIILYPEVVINKVDVEKRLAEAEADLKAGRVHGLFGSVDELLSSLRREKPTKKKRA
jgi:AbrB family looped-hinge helix DNA binding protein